MMSDSRKEGGLKKGGASFVLNLGLVICSLFAALALAEFALPLADNFAIEEAVYQVRRPVVQYLYGQFHPQLRYTLEHNLKDIRLLYPKKLDYTVGTNNFGFRGPQWDLDSGRRNVVVLGDSFAFGWGVAWDETMGRVLERELQKNDPRFQVVNLAISGYSLKEVINSLAFFKDQLRPEAVIYLFCPNDIESLTAEETKSGAYQIAYQPKPEDEQSWSRIRLHNRPDYWSWDKWRHGSYLHAFYARYVRPIISKRIRQSLHHDPLPAGMDFPPPLVGAAPPATAEFHFLKYGLQRIFDLAAGRPVYLLPTSDKSILVKKDDDRNLRWVLKAVADSDARGRFLDFESAVRTTPKGRGLYLDYDDHWSPRGHALAARMVLDAMTADLTGRTSP